MTLHSIRVLAGALVVALLCFSLAFAQDATRPAAENLLQNGGFEEREKGWLYHQWAGKAVPGSFDTSDFKEGGTSFKFSVPGAEGGRYLAKEVTLPDVEQDYVVTFFLKLDNVPPGAARVAVSSEGRGWITSTEGKSESVKTGGTQDWKQYTIPVPASAVARGRKLTIFFYHDKVGTGVIGIDGVALRPWKDGPLPDAHGNAATPVLHGDTDKPVFSTYISGEPVALTFSVTGLQPKAQTELHVSIVDAHGTQLHEQQLPVEADERGQWKQTLPAPHDRLGFYRVYAKLTDGVDLAGIGSRKPGFLTYAVVPDPTQRKDYGEFESRFGIQGGFGPWADDVLPLLGARWVLDGSFEWRKLEPNAAGEFKAASAKIQPNKGKWKTYTLPTLFAAPKWAVVPETLAYMTGTLTPEGEQAWAAYCREAVSAYMAKNPDRQQRIYQITWEPIQPWGFKGTHADLVRIYEIAYRVIHDTDPRAAVAGPCRGINHNDPRKHIPLYQLGLGRYTDIFSTHPYYAAAEEREGMVRDLRAMRDVLKTYAGKEMPMIGTEQGLSTDEDPAQDLDHARANIRQNLITLGEGFRFNMAFYIVDYRLSGQRGYGYYYNLTDGVRWGPAKIAPRPVAPAYAAQSLLLDGHESVGAIEWLGESCWGYAFQREDNVVLALWNYEDKPRQVTLAVGVPEVKVYDWMGNARVEPAPNGRLTVTLTAEPIYVQGVSPTLWGRQAKEAITVNAAPVQLTPGGVAKIGGAIKLPFDKPFAGKLELSADALRAGKAYRDITVQPSQFTDYAFDVSIPADAAPGKYPVQLVLNDAHGSVVAMAGATIEVMPPMAIARVEAVPTGQGRGVAITLQNRLGDALDGSVEVELAEVLSPKERPDLPMIDLPEGKAALRALSETKRTQSFKLDANGSQQLVVTYPADVALLPTQAYQARLTVKTASGYTFTTNAPVNFLFATRLPTPPKVDADLSEWRNVPAVKLSGKRAIVRSAKHHSNDADLSADLRFTWDDQALHIAVDVTDDAFYQSRTDDETWRGDCLQIAFDPTSRQAKEGSADHRHSELNVALTPAGVQIYRSLSFDVTKLPHGLIPADQISAAVQRRDGGIVYELSIPWATIGATAPKAGDALGIAMTVNDSDATDQNDPSALGLFGGITPSKDAARLGLILLAPSDNAP